MTMPGNHFVILMLLLWPFVGGTSGEQKVKGVLHSQVELHICHEHQQNASRVEWAKYRSPTSKRLLYVFEKTNTSCFCNCCQNIHFDVQNMSLILVNLTAEDEAVYEKKVVFSNQTIKCNITLSLLSPPAALRIAVNTSRYTLTLRCEVRGEFLNLHWLRDSLPLPDDQRISLSERNMTVHVSNLSRSDWGRYTCQVSNADGTSEAHVNISGENTTHCQDSSTAHTINPLHITGFALIPIILLCVIFICLCRYGFCRRNSANRRKGRRNANGIAKEEPVYDEPNHPQERDTPRVASLPYVYTDYIKPKAQRASDERHQDEESGYSTIEEVRTTLSFQSSMSQ